MPTSPARTLTDLGFTPLEAAAYAYLLESAPTTGYQIARAIGKPVANTYKAIESLATKGALLIDEGDGEKRLCRAVAPGELLRGMERAFSARCAAAESSLASLHKKSGDSGVYEIRSREQCFERAREMLARAERVALVDAFPGSMRELREATVECAARGVTVWALAYEPVDLGKARVVLAPETKFVRDWIGDQICIAIDAREWLVGLIEGGRDRELGEVMQALWTESVFLASIGYDDLIAQIFTKMTQNHIARGDPIASVKESFESLRPIFTARTAGYEGLVARFRRP
ncbi:MAG TPA: helix-turn-helix domain-containing protein [Phycisphaerales bacterium]|nr:helix-turn-helix domain-containing protein [Phycisphaerales bacterium]